MQEHKFIEGVDLNLLANPIEGRTYLKAALNTGNERDFLQALHNIMDGLLAAENTASKTFPISAWEDVEIA